MRGLDATMHAQKETHRFTDLHTYTYTHTHTLTHKTHTHSLTLSHTHLCPAHMTPGFGSPLLKNACGTNN